MTKERIKGKTKVSKKLYVILKFKETGRPMKQFRDTIGREAGISTNYANKLIYQTRKKLGMNTVELILAIDKLHYK